MKRIISIISCVSLFHSAVGLTPNVSLKMDDKAPIDDRGAPELAEGLHHVSSAPRFYRGLSQYSIGRHLVATSYLIGECTRLYAPAPLGVIATSLYRRATHVFFSGIEARGQTGEGRQSQPSVSYAKFLSHDNQMEDEEPLEDAVFAHPEKYGRVSLAFLARHSIGNGSNHQMRGDPNEISDISVQQPMVPTPLVTPDVPKSGVSSFKETGVGTIAHPRRPSQARSPGASVFKSLGGFRRNSHPVQDDLDLLSESDDGDMPRTSFPAETSDTEEGRGGSSSRNLHPEPNHVTSLSVSKNSRYPGTDSASHSSIGGRTGNLVGRKDDQATVLLDKLRGATRGSEFRDRTDSSDSRMARGKKSRGQPRRRDGEDPKSGRG